MDKLDLLATISKLLFLASFPMDTPYQNTLFTKVYPTHGRVNDHSLIHDGKQWHLFHIWLTKDRDDVIGHATSSDLFHWQEQPDILPKGNGPSWETHSGGNAPYVYMWDGIYYLFYSRYDDRPHPDPFYNPFGHDALQHIGVATSRDLFHWEKYPGNPIFHPMPSWSPWEDHESDQFRPHCCRDPHVMRIGEQFVMYYVAMSREPNVSAVAYAISDDLIHWRDQGSALKAPIRWIGTGMCESPCLVHAGNCWHLFYKHGKWTQHAASDNPFEFSSPKPLVDAHAAEIFSWNDQWYITHCERDGLYLAKMEFRGDTPRIISLREASFSPAPV